MCLELEFQSKGASALSDLVPARENTETWQVGKQAQKANDSPQVTSRSVVLQDTEAALPSINQRHFLAATKNATLKQSELWKVLGVTVQSGTSFVTFQNSKWSSLVKKHWTAAWKKQRMFFCKTCWKALVAFVIGSELLSELKPSTVTSKRGFPWRPAPGSASILLKSTGKLKERANWQF